MGQEDDCGHSEIVAALRGLRLYRAADCRRSDPARLRALADRMDLVHEVADLGDPERLRALVGAHALVLNAAGPFSQTSRPLIEACLETGTSYVDVSGEFQHMRSVAACDRRAREAGTALLTGAGFGATFGDCLA